MKKPNADGGASPSSGRGAWPQTPAPPEISAPARRHHGNAAPIGGRQRVQEKAVKTRTRARKMAGNVLRPRAPNEDARKEAFAPSRPPGRFPFFHGTARRGETEGQQHEGDGFCPSKLTRGALRTKKPGTSAFPVSAMGPGAWRKTPGRGRHHDIMGSSAAERRFAPFRGKKGLYVRPLPGYSLLISILRAAGFSGSLRGISMHRTPSLWVALILSTSASSGRDRARRKEP